jgi:hypothetical protein
VPHGIDRYSRTEELSTATRLMPKLPHNSRPQAKEKRDDKSSPAQYHYAIVDTPYVRYKSSTNRFIATLKSMVPSEKFKFDSVNELMNVVQYVRDNDVRVERQLLSDLKVAIRLRKDVANLNYSGGDKKHSHFINVLVYCWSVLSPLARWQADRAAHKVRYVAAKNKFDSLSDSNGSDGEDVESPTERVIVIYGYIDDKVVFTLDEAADLKNNKTNDIALPSDAAYIILRYADDEVFFAFSSKSEWLEWDNLRLRPESREIKWDAQSDEGDFEDKMKSHSGECIKDTDDDEDDLPFGPVPRPTETETTGMSLQELVSGTDREDCILFLMTLDGLMGNASEYFSKLKDASVAQAKGDSETLVKQLMMEAAVVSNFAIQQVKLIEQTFVRDHPHLNTVYQVLASLVLDDFVAKLAGIVWRNSPIASEFTERHAIEFLGDAMECAFRKSVGLGERDNSLVDKFLVQWQFPGDASIVHHTATPFSLLQYWNSLFSSMSVQQIFDTVQSFTDIEVPLQASRKWGALLGPALAPSHGGSAPQAALVTNAPSHTPFAYFNCLQLLRNEGVG